MYETYYNLKAMPFQITTDPKFLWLGEKHSEALATLKYGILENKGFLLLTGEVGTGKTALINRLVKMIRYFGNNCRHIDHFNQAINQGGFTCTHFTG